MKRKIWAGVTVLSLWMAGFSPAISFADALDDQRERVKKRDKEIQRLEKEKQATLEEKEAAFAELSRMKGELEKLNQSVYDTGEKLKRKKEQLLNKERQIRQQRILFNDRIRTLYQQGEMFYLDTLLQADSFSDFLSRLEFIRLITKRDKILIQNYKTDQKFLAEEKKEIEVLLQEEKEKAEKAEKIHARLTKEYAEYEKDLSALKAKQKDLEAANNEEKRRIRDFLRKQAAAEARKEKASEDVDHAGGKFYWPVTGARMTDGYGMRYHPVRKQYRMHTGIDLAGSMGTPIHAAEDGTVIESRPAKGYGYIVIISHGGGLATLYAHMYPQDVSVKVGQKVSRGQTIARIGNNGWSTGPHLHVEVLKNGNHTDPIPYFK
ncbi:peptidase M23 [Marinithermofilum abyssi]|uniref:Peptidase M23 n=1 Tax=Marinithermofilum abyssi TaxID=1571185 RepID=A0A8J2VF34_9BACL|nr:M23 family metallopeptidase [Marinithermofilum abyssi]GGE04601.1 peptidase M23 [Marinithermofilum abyssi]